MTHGCERSTVKSYAESIDTRNYEILPPVLPGNELCIIVFECLYPVCFKYADKSSWRFCSVPELLEWLTGSQYHGCAWVQIPLFCAIFFVISVFLFFSLIISLHRSSDQPTMKFNPHWSKSMSCMIFKIHQNLQSWVNSCFPILFVTSINVKENKKYSCCETRTLLSKYCQYKRVVSYFNTKAYHLVNQASGLRLMRFMFRGLIISILI